MIQQLGAEIPHQLLPCVGRQPPVHQSLQVREKRNENQQAYGKLESNYVRAVSGKGSLQEIRQGLLAQNAVDCDFERQWVKECQWKRKEAQSGNTSQMRPATPGLLQYP